jgi:CDP-diacylglycerol--glycerol-3-phosphate 3-phosphatidyltransferase/cardiolipin synthase
VEAVTTGALTFQEFLRPANLLSLVRVPLGFLVWVAPENPAYVLSLVALAGVSDVLDGAVARRSGESTTNLGTWLDPVCDKFFFGSTVVAVWTSSHFPVWLALSAALREFLLLPLLVGRFLIPALRDRTIPYRAKWMGKLTTVLQFLLFAAVLLGHEKSAPTIAIAAGVTGAISAGQYTWRALRAPAQSVSQS